jgi:hypothetical protein
MAADAVANGFANALCDPGLALHKGVEILGVQHQKAGAREDSHGAEQDARRSAATSIIGRSPALSCGGGGSDVAE